MPREHRSHRGYAQRVCGDGTTRAEHESEQYRFLRRLGRMIRTIVCGKGCGKSFEMQKQLHMNPQEYQKYMQDLSKILEESKKRQEQQKKFQWLLWYVYYREEGVFY
jgi:hypothetical protein